MDMTLDDTAIVRHRFNVDEYYRMAEVGILAPDIRVELIDGAIVDMAPIDLPHAALVGVLGKRMVFACGDRAHVWVQNPLRLSKYTEPVPDLMVLASAPDEYRRHRPSPDDALLVVEVAASSLRCDRHVKLPHYARHGVAEVWIVDVSGERLEVCSGPLPDGRYSAQALVDATGPRALIAKPEIVVDLAALF
jgi:Uma2 family endonuclease